MTPYLYYTPSCTMQTVEKSQDKPITYPERINRYLSLKGLCSRRQADRFVKQGLVHINGQPAELGQKVKEGDQVELKTAAKRHIKNYRYYLFNKPIGVVSTNPQRQEKSWRDFTNLDESISVVGRLDKDSRGLLFLTDDGRLVNKMLNPKFDHEKEYQVKVNKPISTSFINSMQKGVNIEGYFTKPAQLTPLSEHVFRLILTEGKKHQIRRMCTALGYEVVDLKRLRIMNLKLGDLPAGEARELTDKEKQNLLNTLDVRDLG